MTRMRPPSQRGSTMPSSFRRIGLITYTSSLTLLTFILLVTLTLLLPTTQCMSLHSQTLPLEMAEILPMSTSELLELADSSADFVSSPPELPHLNNNEHRSLAELEAESEAQIEAEVIAEAESRGEGEAENENENEAEQDPPADAPPADAPPADAPPAPPADPPPAPTPDPAAPPADPAAPAPPADAAAPAAAAPPPPPPPPPPDPKEELKKHFAIRELEKKMANQTVQFDKLPRQPVVPGWARSSGEPYYDAAVKRLRYSAGFVADDKASLLTQSDARCVICQYVVQQAIGLLSGKPLTSGGAIAGGKRAAAAAAAPAGDAPPPASFLEMEMEMNEEGMDEEGMEDEDLLEDDFADSEADPSSNNNNNVFLELSASNSLFESSGLSSILAAESEHTSALSDSITNFLEAADTALEHSAEQALNTHYVGANTATQAEFYRGRRASGRGSTRSFHAPLKDFGGRYPTFGRDVGKSPPQPLRNLAPLTYPDQLNDHGYENPARNKRSDTLVYRPRRSRFTRGTDATAQQAKWDAMRKTYSKLYTNIYTAFETLCTKRMPLAYSEYCMEMMADYRYIAQGIQYGDRAQSICMNGNWCDRQAYIRHAVHAFFVRESGDN